MEVGLGDHVALLPGLDLGLLDGIALQKRVQVLLLAPMTLVVVVLQRSVLEVADDGVRPIWKFHAEARSRRIKQPDGLESELELASYLRAGIWPLGFTDLGPMSSGESGLANSSTSTLANWASLSPARAVSQIASAATPKTQLATSMGTAAWTADAQAESRWASSLRA